jgi:methyl-accepting chemotaxis protein
MFKSLSSRIGLVHLSYIVLLGIVVASTAMVLQGQKDDGLVVNLSGRQRMLTQRITHQLLGFSAQADDGQDTQAQRSAVLQSMQVFEKTLQALEHGGPAPLDLQMVNVRHTPAASPAVAAQLERVNALYKYYRIQARTILDGQASERKGAVSFVINNNTELLSEMNTAVNLMQSEAESRVLLLYYVQAGAIALGLAMAFMLSTITRRTVVEPLRELNLLSDAMSRGDVNRRISAKGPTEIHELGSSFERLRVAMKNLIGSPSGAGVSL